MDVIKLKRMKSIKEKAEEYGLQYPVIHYDADGNNYALYALKEKVNSLEVKEVDLEKELDAMITPELKFHKALPSLFDVAKHFFELGMSVSNKTQKGENV